ncbi:uncharacterized protein LOC62_03G003809 [Vanrija pseudolonga]|uniref:Uncharacterized protein n=1 Tax=Vanrija pseudolonga TaxID=143232 RepID=A0AAF1BJV5_9TREE|nr:hypothetical protein LOC62_03G003809 [Vanrija pseudolonga]
MDNILVSQRFNTDGIPESSKSVIDLLKIYGAVFASPQYADYNIRINGTTSASCQQLGGPASAVGRCEQRSFTPKLTEFLFKIQRNQNCTVPGRGGSTAGHSEWEDVGTITLQQPERYPKANYAEGE